MCSVQGEGCSVMVQCEGCNVKGAVLPCGCPPGSPPGRIRGHHSWSEIYRNFVRCILSYTSTLLLSPSHYRGCSSAGGETSGRTDGETLLGAVGWRQNNIWKSSILWYFLQYQTKQNHCQAETRRGGTVGSRTYSCCCRVKSILRQ